MGVLDLLAGIIFQELRYTEHKSIILADFNKESESKLFFCCLETFPPYFQPFLKTLVTDISESVSDGQHFPALYFFCKVYIFPLLSLKSSRTIISTDSLHFCSQKIAQQVSKQTNQYFSVSDGQKNLSTLTPILSNVFARLSISVLDRHFTCQCFEKTERVARHYKKNKKKQDFKNFPGIRQKLNFANYFFQNENSQNFV